MSETIEEQNARNIQAVSTLLNVPADKIKVLVGQVSQQMGFYWGKWELIRDLEQNELDASQRATGTAQLIIPTFTSTSMNIKDTFGGFDMEEFFIMGGSEKKLDDTSRGLQGTGLKFITSVCINNGWIIIFKSRDWACVPLPTTFGKKTNITYYYVKTETSISGVDIEIKGITQDDHEEIMSYITERFSINNNTVITNVPGQGRMLAEPSGRVYVKGIFVSALPSDFSYDLEGAEVRNLGQDRNAINMDILKSKISRIISNVYDEVTLTKIFDSIKSEKFEININECLNIKNRTAWKNAFQKKYGEKAAILIGSPSDDELGTVKRQGYEPIDFTANAQLVFELRMCGIKTTEQVLDQWSADLRNRSKLYLNQLPAKQQQKLDYAIELLNHWDGFNNIKFHELIEQNRLFFYHRDDNITTLGYYDPTTDAIGISTDVMEEPVESVATTVAHEFIHLYYSDSDGTRRFEDRLQSLITCLMKRFVREKMKK